jgi:integrase
MQSLPLSRPETTVERIAPIPWSEFKAEIITCYSPPVVARATASKMRQVLGIVDALDAQARRELAELQAAGVTDEDKLAAARSKLVATTADLNVPLVHRFVTSRPPGQAPSTLQSLLMTFRAVCGYATAAGYVRVNPFALRKVSRWVRVPQPEGKLHLTREEIRAILALLAKDVEERQAWAGWRARRLQIAVALMCYLGLRKTEALRLQVGDVDLAARTIWIRGHGRALKTLASEAPLPIPAALLPILVNWLGHRMDAPFGYPMPKECPWLIPTCNRKSPWVSGHKESKPLARFKAVAERAGVKNATFLQLRHSWATHAEFFGLGPALIQRVLRHTSTRTAEKHYRHADIPNLIDRTAGFDF